MKQIILQQTIQETPYAGPCLTRLAFIWGGYGIAIAWLWRLTGGDAWSQGAVWALALLAGVWLLLRMRGA